MPSPSRPSRQITTKAAIANRIASTASTSAPPKVASAGTISSSPERTMMIDSTDATKANTASRRAQTASRETGSSDKRGRTISQSLATVRMREQKHCTHPHSLSDITQSNFSETSSVWPLLGGRTDGRQHVIFEAVTQRCFLDLAGSSVWNGVDKHDVVRHPPFGNLPGHEIENLALGCGLGLLQHDDQERALVPFRMLDADHGRFRNFRVSNGEVFQLDR